MAMDEAQKTSKNFSLRAVTRNNLIVLTQSAHPQHLYSSFRTFSYCLIFLFICISTLHLKAEENKGFNLDLGRYYMAVTPKALEDGVQTDLLFGFFYTKAVKIAGEIKFRSIKGSANDQVWGIEDSLLTRDRQVYEIFLLPLNYHFFRKSGFTLRAGAGIYYDYNELKEKGYFNSSTLYEPAGPDVYNAYDNAFAGHALGPLLDAGLSLNKKFFYGSLSFGIVPIFYLNRKQSWRLSPYMSPPLYAVSSESSCGPYFYLNLDMAFNLKYVSIFFSLIDEYTRLNYTAAGFNDTTGTWADVDEKTENKNLAFEISLLINLGAGGFMPQIGYGRAFDDVTGGKNYFLIGVKKQWF